MFLVEWLAEGLEIVSYLPMTDAVAESWLALAIGNSRLHWAWFVGQTLNLAWDSHHLPTPTVRALIKQWTSGRLPAEILPPPVVSWHKSRTWSQPPLYLASVVPNQTQLWQTYPATKIITLDRIPLTGLYPTLGIDRALALLGAGETYGYPILAIDAGTALTLTGADARRQLVGGAILPGLRLQLQSLWQKTAALPAIELPPKLPTRWASRTSEAIQSGVIYAILAGLEDFIADWHRQFPNSGIAIAGGDATLLQNYFQEQFPKNPPQLTIDPHLIFWGMRSLRPSL
jgi:type III pantothenate kinase